MTAAVRIIGIDPGLRNTGWGVIEVAGSCLGFVACGRISSDGELPLSRRLMQLHDGLKSIVETYAPDEAAVEETFVNKGAASTLKLGQARGVAMLVPAAAGLLVGEYAPNAVKKAVTGVGHGDKRQIRTMILHLLPKAKIDSSDAADALAVAICHAHHRGSQRLRELVGA